MRKGAFTSSVDHKQAAGGSCVQGCQVLWIYGQGKNSTPQSRAQRLPSRAGIGGPKNIEPTRHFQCENRAPPCSSIRGLEDLVVACRVNSTAILRIHCQAYGSLVANVSSQYQIRRGPACAVGCFEDAAGRRGVERGRIPGVVARARKFPPSGPIGAHSLRREELS